MFKNLFRRLKGNASEIASSALSADDVTVMEAMIASMTLTAYANGECENVEVDKVNEMIESNPQLKEFYNEPARLFDNYCDQMEASPMMAKIDLNKKIEKVFGDEENATRVLIAGIEVAASSKVEDSEEVFDKDEERVLSEIAKMLDLRLGKFI